MRNRSFTPAGALAAAAVLALSSGCSQFTFLQNPYEAIQKSTPEQISQVHQPQALRADLDAIVALHERTNPNPYLRVSKEAIRALAENQPTGGVPNALGDIGPYALPNSRIVVSFSQKMFVRASGDESDLGPVQPHIEVAPVEGRDATLERAVIEIRRM